MCIQDQRMAAGGTFQQRVDTAPGAVQVTLPDMSRSLWFGVFTDAGVAVQVFLKSSAGLQFALPRNAEYVGLAGAQGYYSRNQCGSMFLGPLVYLGVLATNYVITWFEMDAETSYAIQPQPYLG